MFFVVIVIIIVIMMIIMHFIYIGGYRWICVTDVFGDRIPEGMSGTTEGSRARGGQAGRGCKIERALCSICWIGCY